MHDESHNSTAVTASAGTGSVETNFLHSEPPPEGSAGHEPEPAPAPDESPTRGMLRDAIQKVMDEIAYHETEAKKHQRLAEELRKDLRESFAFFQGRGDKVKLTEPAPEPRPEPAVEPAAKSKSAVQEKHTRAAKKKPAGKKEK